MERIINLYFFIIFIINCATFARSKSLFFNFIQTILKNLFLFLQSFNPKTMQVSGRVRQICYEKNLYSHSGEPFSRHVRRITINNAALRSTIFLCHISHIIQSIPQHSSRIFRMLNRQTY